MWRRMTSWNPGWIEKFFLTFLFVASLMTFDFLCTDPLNMWRRQFISITRNELIIHDCTVVTLDIVGSFWSKSTNSSDTHHIKYYSIWEMVLCFLIKLTSWKFLCFSRWHFPYIRPKEMKSLILFETFYLYTLEPALASPRLSYPEQISLI